jgi:ATP-dependent RNA helicase HelY
VTEEGLRLSRIYCEADLLVSEALRRGVWKGLSPAELAAIVSALVFAARRDAEAYGNAPTGPLRRALADTVRIWDELRADEQRHRLPPTRELDEGFVQAIFLWASGAPLADVLLAAGERGQALSAGDFVRWCRQVLDLLSQVRTAAPDKQVRQAAGKAIDAIRRGVVDIEADD